MRPINEIIPHIGAEIWIEPGQTELEIDAWFRRLSTAGMPCARLLLVWQYLEKSPGVYDFSLYDVAFRAAERYEVKIIASLQTDSRPAHWGEPYVLHARQLPKDDRDLEVVAEYIKTVVGHFCGSPALDTWLHLDETSVAPRNTPWAMQEFRRWLVKKYKTVEVLNRHWRTNFGTIDEVEYDSRWSDRNFHMYFWVSSLPFKDFYEFYRTFNTQWLGWVTEQIKAIDPHHHIHNYIANIPDNHALQSLDIPAWRSMLDSFGCGVHLPWHLGMFRKEQLALGVGLSCDIARGCIEPKPFWLTETQGGSLVLAGTTHPSHPDEALLAQTFWTAIGSGSQRVIYWLLNSRSHDYEAGEWSLLDFQGQDTPRWATVVKMTKTLAEHELLFAGAKPWTSPVTVILSLETETLAAKLRADDLPGRGAAAHLEEAYGIYEALQNLGIPVNVKFWHDFDWNSSETGRVAILPHATAVTKAEAAPLEDFVARGNSLLVTGLTGLYDEWVRFQPGKDNSLRSVLGGDLKDIVMGGSIGSLSWKSPHINLPTHLWGGMIHLNTAQELASKAGVVTASVHHLGQGQSWWIPSLVGLGARQSGNFGPLSRILLRLLDAHFVHPPLQFRRAVPGLVQRILVSSTGLVQVLVNTNRKGQTVAMVAPGHRRSEVLWKTGNCGWWGNSARLGPGAVLVTAWVV